VRPIRFVKRVARRLVRLAGPAGGPPWSARPPAPLEGQAPSVAAVPSLPSGDVAEPDLLRLAEALAWARPVGTFPGWRFDIDFDKPLPGYQMRRAIWSYFRSRNKPEPVVVPWTDGLRLQLYLGNDQSRQLFVAGCTEPNEFAFLDRVLAAGMTFLDVGANDGLYTLFAARRVGAAGTVWAFEPSPREVRRLERNLALNPAVSARVFPVALSDYDGQAPMRIAEEEHAGCNTLGDFCHIVEMTHRDTVRVRRLDDIVREEGLGRVDVMKIDAEGGEVGVLGGALQTLQAHRPVLMLEVVDKALRSLGASEARLLEFLEDLDYRLHVYDDATGEPRPARRGENSVNVVALPIESRLARDLRRAA
jgi:FkbM family methyltransferase